MTGEREPGLTAQPFTIHVGDDVLADLRARVRGTRWPDQAPGGPWEQGADLGYLRRLLGYWADGFDWRAREAALNGFSQFRAVVDGVRLHFVHERARRGEGIPLILGHGWPSAFTELLPLVPLLTDPAAHGIDGPAFDLVIPSQPGYGFSERPRQAGVNYRYVAGLWRTLMHGLGYRRYGAGGGDFGAGVATLLALDAPGTVIGLHLSNLELSPFTGPGSRPLSAAEAAYLADGEAWQAAEGGYKAIQSTRPQTLGYGLNDSPAGLAAWIGEKWRSWSDSGGDLDRRIGRDFLLELLTIYWATQTVTSSMRDYFDNRWHPVSLGPGDRVTVPTAVAGFNREFAPEGRPPREWATRLYQVHRWTPMPRGGHFAAVEEPRLLAQDIAAFFGSLPGGPPPPGQGYLCSHRNRNQASQSSIPCRTEMVACGGRGGTSGMTRQLAGKVALVTGAGRGIGAAVARALADEGADVAISYSSSAEAAEKVVAELQGRGVRAKAFKADQSRTEEATGLIEDVAAEYGRIDILVNNAGVLYWGAVGAEGEDLTAFARQLSVNYVSVVAAIRAVLPHMGEGGRIISLGSGVSTRVGASTMTDYAGTKAAIVGFSKGLARDLAPRGITVNVVQCGHINTDMNPADAPWAAANAATSALGRYGEPDEVAYGVVALASPRASYITGTTLTVDGGYLA